MIHLPDGSYAKSLRDIVSYLRAMHEKLYHMGIRAKISLTTLTRANENTDWRIYGDFAQVLIHQTRRIYANDDFGLKLNETGYALDSTAIDL